MKKHFVTAAIALFAFVFNVEASVQPAFPGLSEYPVSQLYGGTSVFAAAIGGSSAMDIPGHVYSQIALGTNSNLYIDQNNPGQSWVAYTLDASSSITSTYPVNSTTTATSITPITGTLWLSFNTNTQTFGMYFDKISSPGGFDQQPNFSPYPNQPMVSTLIGGSNYPSYTPPVGANASIGLPFVPCIECSFSSQLNLSFLDLQWTGNSYDLFLNDRGFDQILSINSTFTNYNSQYTFNIAPVPAPPAIWLFGSGIFSMLINARRKFKIC